MQWTASKRLAIAGRVESPDQSQISSCGQNESFVYQRDTVIDTSIDNIGAVWAALPDVTRIDLFPLAKERSVLRGPLAKEGSVLRGRPDIGWLHF